MNTTTRHQQMVTRLAKPGADIIASLTPAGAHLWHMASCIMGEVAELITAIESCDGDNILEELGDIEFYLEGYLQGADISRSDLVDEATVDDQPRLLVQVSGDLFDVTKKHVIYGQPFDSVKAIQYLTDIDYLLYQVRHENGWSHQDVLDANYRKLSKRYPDMVERIRVTLPSAPVESPPTVNLTNRLPHPPLSPRPPAWPAVVMALIVVTGLLLALVLLSGCHSPQLPPVGPIPDLPAFDSIWEAGKPATLVEP